MIRRLRRLGSFFRWVVAREEVPSDAALPPVVARRRDLWRWLLARETLALEGASSHPDSEPPSKPSSGFASWILSSERLEFDPEPVPWAATSTGRGLFSRERLELDPEPAPRASASTGRGLFSREQLDTVTDAETRQRTNGDATAHGSLLRWLCSHEDLGRVAPGDEATDTHNGTDT